MNHFNDCSSGSFLALCVLILFSMISVQAQKPGFNYDEEKVPQYTLPSVLKMLDGSKITTSSQWTRDRRGEVLKIFENEMYGRRPGIPKLIKVSTEAVDGSALGGKAFRKEVVIGYRDVSPDFEMRVLIYTPANSEGPVPMFLGYNFNGNHTIHSDPEITLSKAWMRRGNEDGNVDHRATDAARGLSATRWPVEVIIARGYGLATLYYGDIEPDHAEGWKDGIRAHIKEDQHGKPMELEDWSAISAWAWGLSRVMDYFETDPSIDETKVALLGHSRLGKTSLWAGASDERFAITISNDSGCGGAALSRRAFGETVKRINTNFPHWFCGNFKQYNDNEAALPMDQHMLLALMAPRPVYVASAQDDQWADPNGEFLSAKHAGPVYQLFYKNGVGVEEQPPVNHPVGDTIGYHIRTGKHDVTDFDWAQYLNFADRHFK
jgi:hypothetical protein